MFKRLQVNVNDVTGGSNQPTSAAVVNDVFRVLHGFYGVLFTSKFATGVVDAAGKDKGILSARKVWAFQIQRYESHTVANALEACKAMHPEFPPSLPQFVALCAANKPRAVYKPAIPEIEMSGALRSLYAAKSREIVARHTALAESKRTGFIDLPLSLDGLKQNIAMAVSLAGGDEAATLLRLDRMFENRVAA